MMTSLGDMAQQFTLARNTTAIKSDLNRLANSLSTGKVDDITRALGGETTGFSQLTYDLAQLDAYMATARETQISLANTQTVLDRLSLVRGQTADVLLRVNDLSNGIQISDGAQTARTAFQEMVDILNTRIGDRSLFAGTRVDTEPLIDAEAMLADLQSLIPTGASANDIALTVQAWFEDPSGGFATIGYQGSTDPTVALRVSEDRRIDAPPRADDPDIKSVLTAAALSAVVNELPWLDEATSRALLNQSGQMLQASGDQLISVQARQGGNEQRVSEALAELQAHKTSLGIQRNTLEQADPFETATALQTVQLQLETHFSAMARLSQLSLLRYL